MTNAETYNEAVGNAAENIIVFLTLGSGLANKAKTPEETQNIKSLFQAVALYAGAVPQKYRVAGMPNGTEADMGIVAERSVELLEQRIGKNADQESKENDRSYEKLLEYLKKRDYPNAYTQASLMSAQEHLPDNLKEAASLIASIMKNHPDAQNDDPYTPEI
jgi:hypothetical protein